MSVDYRIFAISDFDPNAYANAVLAGDSYPFPTASNAASSSLSPSLELGTSPGSRQQGDGPGLVQTQPQAGRKRLGVDTVSILEPAREDISIAISKLDVGIEDVNKQIKALVTAHHEDLLIHASNVRQLSTSLASVRQGLGDVESSIQKLRQKIRVPYQSLQTHVTRLQRIHQANDALRRIARFSVLEKRLKAHMSELASYDQDADRSRKKGQVDGASSLSVEHESEKERVIVRAALNIAELGALLDDGPSNIVELGDSSQSTGASTETGSTSSIRLRSITAVAAYITSISDARTKINQEMEAMVIRGLTTLASLRSLLWKHDQSLLASSLQTAYNLRILPNLVSRLVSDLSEAVEDRIRNAFDLSSISKEIVAKDTQQPSQSLLYKSRVRTEPTSVTAPQFSAALWQRLESLVTEMSGCCVKVYTLEKVLNLKKDPTTGTSFLDESMKALENKPSSIFWASLGKLLEKCARDTAKSSTFLQQTLGSGYLKLLRLFHEFFASIALHTDTVYTQTHQSEKRPETVVVLRALSTFEGIYLTRSSTRLNETVAQAFSAGARAPPGANDGIAIVRTVANELDSARFDPLLVRAVAKNAATTLEALATKVDSLIATDRSAVSLLGPLATPQQILNGQVASCLYYCWTKLDKLTEEHSDAVSAIIQPSINKIRAQYNHVVNPLLTAIRKEIAVIISRLHKVDLQRVMDPTPGMAGSSLYMKDVVDKLNFIKTGIFSNFAPELARTWIPDIVKYVIRIFVLHASIAKPLGESGKLQLTTDMTEFEFALNAFLADNLQGKRGGNLESIGEEYKTLRAMRPLLFLENSHLACSERTAGLPPLVVLHHILVRSPIALPHTLHGWQEAEYVRWIDEHSPRDAWSLVESTLLHWEGKNDGPDKNGAQEYVDLTRSVLRHAKGEVEC
ncbi:Golgi transport complex subunit 5-domain-containing protein [Scleroderma citrinum]